MNFLQDQHVLILGLGTSGLAMARWCVRMGAKVTVADTRDTPPGLGTLQGEVPEARFVPGTFTASLVEGTDVRAVFRSPGLKPGEVAPVMDAAVAQGLWTGGELDLFARALQVLKDERGYAPHVLAVTGTNGKTTVTALTGQLVERAGKRVAVAGNIGPTLLDTLTEAIRDLPEKTVAEAVEEDIAEAEGDTATELIADQTEEEPVAEPESEAAASDEAIMPAIEVPPAPPVDPAIAVLPEVWVLELSSFQLDGVKGFEPTAAALLNITQDHLDWHGDMQAYAAAKSRVFGSRGAMLLNREDPLVMAMQPPSRAKNDKTPSRVVVTFGADMPARPGDFGIETVNGMAWLVRAHEADETRRKRRNEEEEELHIQRLMPVDALRIHGRHNAVNALSALALAVSAGCQLAPMLYGLREYRGEPHRVEPVGVVHDVEYFDDSKGTNVGATVAALQGIGADRRVVVILGGEGKGQDFSPLAAPVQRFARAAVLIGRDAPIIRAALEGTGVTLLDATSMEDAVAQATQRAHAGDAVLMSPACASFDMFDNYPHRGRVFRAAVEALQEEAL
ncbi:UDP-N-acetylmuramoyl-L-alanine--D-glutamate ligase [Variovorax sp. VNK109]|uniref:UDP-N-acetylmuramoyl-L-alanine--D-glutamate ligase n=1 Tax=Variovorax sp. VNK109 TaxID=3400919 RepID=UPI003C04239D